MDKKQIDLTIHLMAIEYCIALIGRSAFIAASGDPAKAVTWAKALRNSASDHLTVQPLPINDPAMADHVADELQKHVDRILMAVEEMLEKTVQQRSGQQ